jgi:hypothetical protein
MWLDAVSPPAPAPTPAPAAQAPSAADRLSYQRAQARVPATPAAGTVQAQQRDAVRQSAALRTPAGTVMARGARPTPARDAGGAAPSTGLAPRVDPGHADAASVPGNVGQAGAGQGAGVSVGTLAGLPGAAAPTAPPDALAQALTEKVAGLAPHEALFELLLPGGQHLAVLVARNPAGLQLWLTPGDAGLKQQLSARRMELEGALTRRMGQAARITVL